LTFKKKFLWRLVILLTITRSYIMPRTIRPYRKKRRPPSFRKLVQPVEKMLHKVPALESKGDRPLKMFFEDQLNALIFFHLVPVVILSRFLKKTTLHVKTSPRRTASKKAVSSRPSITEGWNNSNLFMQTFAAKHPGFFPISMPNSENLSPLMVR